MAHPAGFEPATPALEEPDSSNWATSAIIINISYLFLSKNGQVRPKIRAISDAAKHATATLPRSSKWYPLSQKQTSTTATNRNPTWRRLLAFAFACAFFIILILLNWRRDPLYALLLTKNSFVFHTIFFVIANSTGRRFAAFWSYTFHMESLNKIHVS